MQNRFWIRTWLQLGQMDQTLDTVLNAGKGTERSDLGYRTGDDLSGGVPLLNSCPGIDLGTFDRERDFLLLFIDAQYLYLDLLSDMEDSLG